MFIYPIKLSTLNFRWLKIWNFKRELRKYLPVWERESSVCIDVHAPALNKFLHFAGYLGRKLEEVLRHGNGTYLSGRSGW
jgi:hypothetical protein